MANDGGPIYGGDAWIEGAARLLSDMSNGERLPAWQIGQIIAQHFRANLRDWFAGMALGNVQYRMVSTVHNAKLAYELADAMLAEREKRDAHNG